LDAFPGNTPQASKMSRPSPGYAGKGRDVVPCSLLSRSSILNPKPKTKKQKNKTQVPKPKTRTQTPKTKNQEPKTQIPKPQTQKPKLKTQNPNAGVTQDAGSITRGGIALVFPAGRITWNLALRGENLTG
jgi:outer membrane biosynthesis protein TonB